MEWLRKADSSMVTTFEAYQEAEEDNEEDFEPSFTRLKVPSSSTREQRFSQTMSISLTILTRDKGYKNARIAKELDFYDAAYRVGLLKDDPLMNDSFEWWLQLGEKEYPMLFKMAVDFLSIPSTSGECERALSGGGRTVTAGRNALGEATVEGLQMPGFETGWLAWLDRLPKPTTEESDDFRRRRCLNLSFLE